MDPYWEKIGEEVAQAKKERTSKLIRLTKWQNSSYWQAEWRRRRFRSSLSRKKYLARIKGKLVLCLRCDKYLSESAYRIDGRGRAHDFCKKCQDTLDEKYLKKQSKVKLCKGAWSATGNFTLGGRKKVKLCLKKLRKDSRWNFCSSCFNTMSLNQRVSVTTKL